MNTQSFKTVRTSPTQAEAGLFISLLEQAGLHPLGLVTSGHCSLAGADIDYSIQVPAAEAIEASEILHAYDANVA